MSMLTDAEQLALLNEDGPITEKIVAIAERIAEEKGEVAVERVLKELLPFLRTVDDINNYIKKLKRALNGVVKG